jgi:hypothetical protein
MTIKDFKDLYKKNESNLYRELAKLDEMRAKAHKEYENAFDELSKAYCEENHKFSIGDRVKRTDKTWVHAIVRGYRVKYYGEPSELYIEYDLSLIKYPNEIAMRISEDGLELVKPANE